jgi:hypothetical protein
VSVDLCQRHSSPHVVVIVVLVWRIHGTYPHIDERYSLTLIRYIIGAGGCCYAVGQERRSNAVVAIDFDLCSRLNR